MDNEALGEWLSVFIVVCLLWGVGYWGQRHTRDKTGEIYLPSWLVLLAGRGPTVKTVRFRGFAVQMLSLVLLLWDTVLVIVVHDAGLRRSLLVIGYTMLFILAGLFVIGCELWKWWLNRKR